MHWVSGFAGLQLLLGTGFFGIPIGTCVRHTYIWGEAPSEMVVFWVDFFCLQNGIDFEFYALYT